MSAKQNINNRKNGFDTAMERRKPSASQFIRRLHLYLGVAFAPLLIFFALTGAWQTFGLHAIPKDGSAEPPAWVIRLSQVHKSQATMPAQGKNPPPLPLAFRVFVLLAATGLIVNGLTGIYMAFKSVRNNLAVGLIIVAGFIVPILFAVLLKA